MKKAILTVILSIVLATTAYAYVTSSGVEMRQNELAWYAFPIGGDITNTRGIGVPGSYDSTMGKQVTLTSEIIDNYREIGFFGLQLRIQGSGTSQIRYLASTDCTIFRPPENTTWFETGMTSTGGDESDGNYYLSFSPVPSMCMRLQISPTLSLGGSVSPTSKLSHQ